MFLDTWGLARAGALGGALNVARTGYPIMKAGYTGFQSGIAGAGMKTGFGAAISSALGIGESEAMGVKYFGSFLKKEGLPAISAGLSQGFSHMSTDLIRIGEAEASSGWKVLGKSGAFGAMAGVGVGLGMQVLRSNRPVGGSTGNY